MPRGMERVTGSSLSAPPGLYPRIFASGEEVV